jgi:hypothetical protein
MPTTVRVFSKLASVGVTTSTTCIAAWAALVDAGAGASEHPNASKPIATSGLVLQKLNSLMILKR